ncbi:MAG: hypothetical protein ACUVUG_06070 [Candidatus Aminicenantia bacterium]
MKRKFKDMLSDKLFFLFSLITVSFIFLLDLDFSLKVACFEIYSLEKFVFSNSCNPTNGEFGLTNFIVGTIWIVLISMIIAIPLGILTSIFLYEYAPKKLKDFLRPLIDLLAGISPVVYGLWGIITMVPLVIDYIMPFLSKNAFFLFSF